MDMSKEYWKNVKGNKRYKVSTFGNVYDKEKEKMLKIYVNKGGYCYVYFSDKLFNEFENKLVHRLVAEAFILNPSNKKTVNHKDENKQNNNVLNLSWATHKEQCYHGTRMKRIKEIMNFKSIRNKNTGIIYDSMREAERITGVSEKHISKACNKKYKKESLNDWEFID